MMHPVLQPALLGKFSKVIENEMGLYFPEEKWEELARGVRAITKDLRFKDEESCLLSLMCKPLQQQQIEILASYLTIGETYFFREPALFHYLETSLLPALIQKRLQENNKQIRIWCAGCASGEEPYTLAIILKRILPDIQHWRITLLATDINTHALKKAEKGIYKDWSFRGVSDQIKSTYFNQRDEGYEIIPDIKKMISLEYLNLSKDIYPSIVNNTNAIDILLCRNVLMYFSPDLIDTIVGKLSDCLTENGCLIVSPSESNHIQNTTLTLELINNTLIHYKKSRSKIDEFVDLTSLHEVINDTETIIQDSPIPSASHIELAKDLANQGKIEQALECCDEAIKESKMEIYPHYLRVLLLIELKQYDAAEIELRRVLYLDQNFVPGYLTFANLLRHKGSEHDALQYLNKALTCVNALPKDDIIPESGGLTAGRLSEIIMQMSVLEK